MHMISRWMHILVLIGLLMQGTVGAVSPAAVLCFSANHIDCHTQVTVATGGETGADAGALHDCCTEGSERARPVAMITPPCFDECPSCIDLRFPDDLVWSDGRPVKADVLTLGLPAPLLTVVAVARDAWHPRIAPTGTGPPGLHAGPDIPLVRSTRLLL